MADETLNILKAMAILFFSMSGALIIAALGNWYWPESKWPVAISEPWPQIKVLVAIIFFLMGIMTIAFDKWKQRQQEMLEK